jgi:hypothetical protein
LTEPIDLSAPVLAALYFTDTERQRICGTWDKLRPPKFDVRSNNWLPSPDGSEAKGWGRITEGMGVRDVLAKQQRQDRHQT